jgi:hypothetical protein
MTDKEQEMCNRLDKYLYENRVSSDCIVSLLKLLLEYGEIGSCAYLANIRSSSPQYINRIANKHEINGINFYCITETQ